MNRTIIFLPGHEVWNAAQGYYEREIISPLLSKIYQEYEKNIFHGENDRNKGST